MKIQSLRRGCVSLLLGATLMWLGGHATVPVQAQENHLKIEQEFMDAYGDYEIISKNSDLYIIKDGDENCMRRITNTPGLTEVNAVFIREGKEILYSVIEKKEAYFTTKEGLVPSGDKFYSQKFDEDDSMRKEIDWKKYYYYKYNFK